MRRSLLAEKYALVAAAYLKHDPTGAALKRAIRVAVVMPATFAFAFEVIGNVELATFTAFGCFAMLLFVEFPGDAAGRLTSYLMLGLTGVVLITLGTLASRATWLAVVAMAVVGTLVLFAGTLSAAIAAGGRSALLLFILPVTLPAPVSDITTRLAGWGLAVGVAIPAVMLLWPPVEHNNLRRFAADTCHAVADVIEARGRGEDAAADESGQRLAAALAGLRRAFRATATRPVGLTTGSRLLIRLVDELEWVGAIASTLTAADMAGWSATARAATDAGAEVMRTSGTLLRAERGSMPDGGRALDQALVELAQRRRQVARTTRDMLLGTAPLPPALHAGPAAGAAVAPAAGAVAARGTGEASSTVPGPNPTASSNPPGSASVALADAWPYQGHQLNYAAFLVGTTVRWAAEADARPALARFFGRQPQRRGRAPLSPALQIATSQVERHSVWLQNAVRGGLGLALAVLVAELAGTQHAFWVVLAASSVLRSNALSTGSNAVRAVLGTVVGFAIGSLIVLAIGTSTGVLWGILPVAVLIAAITPSAISFSAGQAGFTVELLILFNIIAPVGWKIGLVRVEDIALGCGASLLVGALLWPRGAGAAIGVALNQAYRVSATYLEGAVTAALGQGSVTPTGRRSVLAAGRRLDDALRQYLSERGAKNVPLEELTLAVNGASRLRLAGEAIEELEVSAIGGDPGDANQEGGATAVSISAGGLVDGSAAAHFPAAAALLDAEVAAVRDHFLALADELDPQRRRGVLPAVDQGPDKATLIAALRQDVTPGRGSAAEVQAATKLLWIGLYLHDLRLLERRLNANLSRSAVVGQEPAPDSGAATVPAAGRIAGAPAAAAR